jgi:hypothetical protein
MRIANRPRRSIRAIPTRAACRERDFFGAVKKFFCALFFCSIACRRGCRAHARYGVARSLSCIRDSKRHARKPCVIGISVMLEKIGAPRAQNTSNFAFVFDVTGCCAERVAHFRARIRFLKWKRWIFARPVVIGMQCVAIPARTFNSPPSFDG